MKTVSAVINARKGSTRVPNKLLRKFSNSSLIEIALEKLNNMDFFEKKYLAIAEEEFEELLVNYNNIEILRRSKKAVNRGVNPLKVTFAHYLDVKTDYVFVFNPCLPCISVDSIKTALDYFHETDFSSYTAVVPTGDWIFDDKGKPLTNVDPQNATTNKNISFKKGCHAFHIIPIKRFRDEGILWEFNINDPHLIEIPIEEAIDVDTIPEFYAAEILYNEKTNKNK